LCLRGPGHGWRKSGFSPRKIGVEVFEAELQLSVVELPPTKLAALQLLDDEAEPFDLGVCTENLSSGVAVMKSAQDGV
jgi:hypothetical protein